MHIRPYHAADRQRCLGIFDSNTPLYFAYEERSQFCFWLDAHDQEKAAYEDSLAEHYYVIEEGGIVMGCGGFSIRQETGIAGMTWGMIDQAQHRKGLGRALFAHRLAQIQQLYPGSAVVLDTSQHSFPFFEKFGFKTVKITEDGYGPGLHRYDMLLAE